MLNKRNLMIADIAASQGHRYNIHGVNITPEETVATDGKALVKVARKMKGSGETFLAPMPKVRKHIKSEMPLETDLKPALGGYEFPDFKRVVPNLEDMEHAIAFDVVLLERVVNTLKRLTKGTKGKRFVTLYIPSDSKKAMRIDTETPEGQEVVAVVMPYTAPTVDKFKLTKS